MSVHHLQLNGFRGWIGLVLSAVVTTLLSGCGDGYPGDLKYPLRTDGVVLSTGTGTVPGLDNPGPEGWKEITEAFKDQERGKGKLGDPSTLPSGFRTELTGLLDEHFGTPAAPKISGGDEEATKEAIEKLRLGSDALKAGSKLYRQHCLHCHGLTGDGRGPTGSWVNPHPRDYRQGMFKFVSTSNTSAKRKAHRSDLIRVIREGIDGTSMPSFSQLPAKDLEHLASYVIHLSVRGHVEFQLMKDALESESKTIPNLKTAFKDAVEESLANWTNSQTPWTPTPYPNKTGEEQAASIKKGFDLFHNKGCYECHMDYGRQRNYKWDEWGTVVRPADLTTGIYRGGRRPIDFFYRIRGGIRPSGMSEQGLKDEEIWDLVEFVRAAPYPAMLEKAGVKNRVYPE